jgi:hypothetical protein
MIPRATESRWRPADPGPSIRIRRRSASRDRADPAIRSRRDAADQRADGHTHDDVAGVVHARVDAGERHHRRGDAHVVRRTYARRAPVWGWWPGCQDASSSVKRFSPGRTSALTAFAYFLVRQVENTR